MNIPKVQLDEKDKCDLLKLLLVENNKELRFWRNRNWTALRDIAAGLIAITSISLFQVKAMFVLLLLVIGIAIIGGIYLKKNYERYQEKLDIKTKIEKALSLYENDIYLLNDKLIADKFQNPKPDQRGTYSFIAAIYILSAATTVAIIIRSCSE